LTAPAALTVTVPAPTFAMLPAVLNVSRPRSMVVAPV
jgi:hypothetical protein